MMRFILGILALLAGMVFTLNNFHISRPDLGTMWPVAVAASVALISSFIANGRNAGGNRATISHILTFASLVAGLAYCLWEVSIIPRYVWSLGWRWGDFLRRTIFVFRANSAWVEWLIAGAGAVLLILIWRWAAVVSGPAAVVHESRKVRAIRRRPGWMRRGEVRKLCRIQVGMPLGTYFGAIVKYAAGVVSIAGHHLVIAGTRAGKGVATVLTAILDHDGPVVVLDVKGENAAVCRRWRARLGRRQVALNPFHLIDGQTQTFNPMTYLRPGPNLQRDVAVLADGLIMPIKGDARWCSLGARELVEAALELVMLHEVPERRALRTVLDMLCGPNRDAMFEAWRDSSECGGRLAKAAGNIMSMGDRQRGAILGHVAESLSWLKFEAMQSLTAAGGADEFSFQGILDGDQDTWIMIPQDMTHALAGFMRVVMNTTLGAITRQDGKTKVAEKVLAVMDEFCRLGELEKILEIATIAAGSGVEAVFVAQDLGQLEDTYGSNGAMTIMGACATTRIFGLGSSDIKTAKWAESLMPDYRVLKRSRTRGADGKRSVTQSEGKEKLLTASELLELPARFMLTRFRGRPGVILEQIVSHEHPAYRARLDPNPVARA